MKSERVRGPGRRPVTPALLFHPEICNSQPFWVYYDEVRNPAKMRSRCKFAFLLATLLASVLFGAQLHCCLDLSSQSIDSHVCPICSVAGAAVVTPLLTMEMAPAINRLEDFRTRCRFR